jgi:RNA polymerase sigma-70 factor (ECF subfamily)
MIDWRSCVQKHVHTVVLGLLANGAPLDEAHELAHDAFARLFEKWATGQLSELEFPGLAMRQAMFLLSERRRNARTGSDRAAPVEDASEVEANVSSPEETLAARESLTVAREALERFSARQQAVLGAVLEAPERPHRELAHEEGISLQRFRQVLCEVRAELRVVLGRVR